MVSAVRFSQTAVAAVVFVVLAASPATARFRFGADGDSRPLGEARPAAGLLVQFRGGVLDADQQRVIGDAGGRLGLRLLLVRAAAVTPGEGETLEGLRARLRAAPSVLRVEDNAPMAVAKAPNDPGFEQQYALADGADNDIDAPAAWNRLTNCAKVAVLDTDKTPFYPAAYPDSNVLSVAATDDRDKLASFSNYGAKSVDLAAPGDAVGSTYLDSEYRYLSGTSMAAPYVAAAAAMLFEDHGSWDAGDISYRLRQKGDELSALRGKTAFGERLNVDRALG